MPWKKDRWLWWACIAMGLLIRVGLACGTELYGDTAYYLTWSERLDLSYFDHPPMIAIMLRLLGVTGTRVVTSVGTIGAIAWGAQSLGTGSGVRAAAFTSLMPIFVIAGAIPTPDSVLFLFSALALAAALRGLVLSAGVAFGLALLSKYSAILLAPALVCAAWQHRARWGLSIAVLLSVGLSWPVVVWNSRHDWVGFRFQFTHGTAGRAPGVHGWLELFLSQFAFMGVVALTLMVAWVWSTKGQGLYRAVGLAFLVPLTVFLAIGAVSWGEANWAAFAAVGGTMALGAATQTLRRQWAVLGTMAPISVAGLVFLTVPTPLTPPSDPVIRLHGIDVLAQLPRDVAAAYAPHYTLASWVHVMTHVPVATTGGRVSQFEVWGPPPTPPGSDALWVSEGEEVPEALAQAYDVASPPQTLESHFGTLTVHRFVVQRLLRRRR